MSKKKDKANKEKRAKKRMKPIRIKEVKVQNDEKSGRYLPEDEKRMVGL